MVSDSTGLTEALERIAKEKTELTGFLDLGRLGLQKLPEALSELRHLTGLNLGSEWQDQERQWHCASANGESNVIQLDRLSGLSNLQSLSISGCAEVSDLRLLEVLPNLECLNCSSTQVSDLTPLTKLRKLWLLDCSCTPVSTLAPLAELTNLQSLDCSHSQVSDLVPLNHLPNLRTLHCSNTRVSHLAPLIALQNLHSLDCSLTGVKDLTPLAHVLGLQLLDCYGTDVASLAPLAQLKRLQALNCSFTQISDLEHLDQLLELDSLHCSNTPITQLPQALPITLTLLDFSHTQVSDLAPLSQLLQLQYLCFFSTQVRDLAPLTQLTDLEDLYLYNTPVTNLAPLAKLTNLQSLGCSNTQITDLSPLKHLSKLESLDCHSNAIRYLSSLAGLPALRYLNCSDTYIQSLTSLKGFPQLRFFNCSFTRVEDLSDLTEIQHYEELDLYDIRASEFPPELLNICPLTRLSLSGPGFKRYPVEILSRLPYENCLDRLRAHIDDQQGDEDLLPDVKLLILGNGRSGKTQLANRLKNEPFEKESDSTHGIIVSTSELDLPAPSQSAMLHIWDFGGQDLYHGTHALFMRSRALVIVMWTLDQENRVTESSGETKIRNHLLPYWLAFVRHTAGTDSPLLIVQNMCDKDSKRFAQSSLGDAKNDLSDFIFFQEVRYSARDERGHPTLLGALREAVKEWRDVQGQVTVGKGRLAVKNKLEEMRQGLKSTRRHALSLTEFEKLCKEVAPGKITRPDLLLDYLHQTGIVFYDKGLFGDNTTIVLDHAWALRAIYTVLDRKRCYKQLRSFNGRFNLSLLADLAWRDYQEHEQKLFLSMMVDCGICFLLQEGNDQKGTENEYLAPDLLPDRDATTPSWDDQTPSKRSDFKFPFLIPGVFRRLMSTIEKQPDIRASYWREAIWLLESSTSTLGLIEQTIDEEKGWQGTIAIRTQGRNADSLLSTLGDWVKKAAHNAGLRDWEMSLRASSPSNINATQPPGKITYAVSYSWRDRGESFKVVDELCAAAQKRGITILRDLTTLHSGDNVLHFMKSLSERDRVFVILTEEYLKSENCMNELYHLWLASSQNPDAFNQKIRLFIRDELKIHDMNVRLDFSDHWEARYKALKKRIENRDTPLDELNYKQYLYINRFSGHVAEMLASFAMHLNASTFEELKQYGFDDASPPPSV